MKLCVSIVFVMLEMSKRPSAGCDLGGGGGGGGWEALESDIT